MKRQYCKAITSIVYELTQYVQPDHESTPKFFKTLELAKAHDNQELIWQGGNLLTLKEWFAATSPYSGFKIREVEVIEGYEMVEIEDNNTIGASNLTSSKPTSAIIKNEMQ